MKYVWQHEHWPHFTYENSDQLTQKITALHSSVSRLFGNIESLKSDAKSAAFVDVLVSEAIKTSQIEGENLDLSDVRSSIKNQLNLNKVPERVYDPRADGISALIIETRTNFDQNLTHELLHDWHKVALPTDHDLLFNRIKSGQYRNSPESMQIVSGSHGREVVHYEAPASKNVQSEMSQFICWFNDSRDKVPGIVRSAIAHLWFEIIHPYEDGNGRLGRAISDVAIAQSFGFAPLLSLSTPISQNKKPYYEQLNLASTGNLDITNWVTWFVENTILAHEQTAAAIKNVLNKSAFWRAAKAEELNERQTKVINKVFDAGAEAFENGISAKKYMSLGKCSKATATRDLAQLTQANYFKKSGVGRGVRYELVISDTGLLNVTKKA